MTQEPVSASFYAHLLICPACRQSLNLVGQILECTRCRIQFPIESGIPRLAWPETETITKKVKSFYEAHPFPDYEGTEDLASLLQNAQASVFARLLDEQIPFGVRVLECGCGTGQLTNFLGIAHRTIFGTDISLNSLQLAEGFRQKHALERVFFLQMDLFHPVFAERTFDYVICNGVLHHTHNPRLGFDRLAHLLRPGGYLIVGLYHRYGRLLTGVRRRLFRLTGERLAFLDPRLRRAGLGKERRSAWFADQYRNPHESTHTISEVLRWLDTSGLHFVKSIPQTHVLRRFSAEEKLFEEESPAGALQRFLKELSLAFRSDPEGGFFTLIAKKAT